MGKATREAYGNALARIGKENTNIIVLDADLSKSTKTDTFKGACPERFFNVGIAEQNLISVGAGLAAAGKIPFVSSFNITSNKIATPTVKYISATLKIAKLTKSSWNISTTNPC